MDDILAVHLNSAVGITGKYGPRLTILVTFILVKDDSDVKKWVI